jgi:hypothetical protein
METSKFSLVLMQHFVASVKEPNAVPSSSRFAELLIYIIIFGALKQ